MRLPSLVLSGLLCLWLWPRPAPAAGAGELPPLERLPAEKIAALAPFLRHGEVALLESERDGSMKQVTVITLVAAPPAAVRAVVADPEHYAEFIPNMKRAVVTRNPDGTLDQLWLIDLTVVSFDGVARFRMTDDAVLVHAPNPGDHTRLRWEFHGVPNGTVMVTYGYPHVRNSQPFIRNLIVKVPTVEHGLGLATLLLQTRAVRARAEKLAGPPPGPVGDPTAKSPGFGFLLDRGRVAVIRTLPSGRLADISLLDRVYAPRERLVDALVHPAAWSTFIDGMERSRELGRDGAALRYELTMSLPPVSLSGRFLLREDPRGIDTLCIEGDLAGARYRWDLTANGPKMTLAVLRAVQNLGAASLVLRTVFYKDPNLEPGIAIAIGMVQLIGLRGRAEGWR